MGLSNEQLRSINSHIKKYNPEEKCSFCGAKELAINQDLTVIFNVEIEGGKLLASTEKSTALIQITCANCKCATFFIAKEILNY